MLSVECNPLAAYKQVPRIALRARVILKSIVFQKCATQALQIVANMFPRKHSSIYFNRLFFPRVIDKQVSAVMSRIALLLLRAAVRGFGDWICSLYVLLLLFRVSQFDTIRDQFVVLPTIEYFVSLVTFSSIGL